MPVPAYSRDAQRNIAVQLRASEPREKVQAAGLSKLPLTQSCGQYGPLLSRNFARKAIANRNGTNLLLMLQVVINQTCLGNFR